MKLDHVALNVTDIEWYWSFFESVFGMNIVKKKAENGLRKIWFQEGIQLIETDTEHIDKGNFLNHIAIKADDKETIYRRLNKLSEVKCIKSDNWFCVKDNLIIEIV